MPSAPRLAAAAFAALVALYGRPAAADDGDSGDAPAEETENEGEGAGEGGGDGEGEGEAPAEAEGDRPRERRTIVVHTSSGEHDERASTVVRRRDIEERLPRSAPDALRYEPGVYVQQTAHSQGSPYVRGVTGQQTVMIFDGIRLNNSTFRQGPNQYFFTIDSRTVQRLEVVRGAASTRYGSDAMGGALLAAPIQPSLALGDRRWVVRPRAGIQGATADGELGGRAQLEVGYRGKLGFVGGVGYRDVGQLRTGGPIRSPATGKPALTPRFADDGVTQLGTGFRELTADGRLVWQASERTRLTLGYYDYRQYDAPRTDRCPPATAPETECLIYDHQFRTLVYGALEHEDGPAAAERVRWTLSYQRQHELRRLERPTIYTRNSGRDDVHTVGSGVRVETRRFEPASWVRLGASYGADAYYDTIRSSAWNVYTDVDIISPQSRGQYLDGAGYLTSGAYAEGRGELWRRLELRVGGRLAAALARAEGDPASASASVHRHWVTPVGSFGAALKATDWLRLLANVDQGFRAPNLDDLTSRQQTGPGFQLEHADLGPESALSPDTGVKIEHPILEPALFAFTTRITDLIARAPVEVGECPPGSAGCSGSQTVFTLANLDGVATIRGLDGVVRILLPAGFGLRTTIAYTWGDGPNPIPGGRPSHLPLSRIPPLNGTAEFTWRSRRYGVFSGAALRWARAQTRLALSDVSDVRIPAGGTPGFAVVDLRAGYRWNQRAMVSMVLENVGNAAYRYHGSSVNGAARGLRVYVEFGF
ncbi:MAG: TonB-dependent receptor [Myxococcales bacterium]|nr:TonB-dependent receptor [Myxococcales bacterium]